MLTKNDLSQIKTVVQETIQPEIKALKQSTRRDIKSLETKLINRIDEAQMEIITTVDKHKADKGKVDNLEKRVERLEDNSGLPPYADQ